MEVNRFSVQNDVNVKNVVALPDMAGAASERSYRSTDVTKAHALPKDGVPGSNDEPGAPMSPSTGRLAKSMSILFGCVIVARSNTGLR